MHATLEETFSKEMCSAVNQKLEGKHIITKFYSIAQLLTKNLVLSQERICKP